MVRRCIRAVHLWLALAFGCLFALQGLTGTALAWMHEIDVLLNPALLRGGLRPATPARAAAVINKLSADPRYGPPSLLMLPQEPGDVYMAWYRPARDPGGWRTGVSRQVMVDGDDLRVCGERNWGEFGFTAPLLMPTLFHFHRYVLAGEIGKTVVGATGIALFATSLTGLVLWWPGRRRGAWRRAIRISYGGSWKRLCQTAHRAVGIVALPLLAFMAFSGVYFNLPDLIVPAVSTVMEVTPPGAVRGAAAPGAPIGPERALLAAQAVFPQAQLTRIGIPSKPLAPYEVRLRQPGELRRGDGTTRVSIDASTGASLRVIDPVSGPAGDRFLGALFPLHNGEALGWPGRVLVASVGLLPLLFLLSGVQMWWGRRSTRAVRGIVWMGSSADDYKPVTSAICDCR